MSSCCVKAFVNTAGMSSLLIEEKRPRICGLFVILFKIVLGGAYHCVYALGCTRIEYAMLPKLITVCRPRLIEP